MSAGRQSPSPERQSGAQQQDTPGTGRTGLGSHPSREEVLRAAKEFQEHMESNPEHPLDRIEAEKFAKGPKH